jgi:putative hydrolase of the HAD superfamily
MTALPTGPVEVVGLDGDDTLWRNEEYFADTQQFFRDLVAPYSNGADLDAVLATTERRNLELFGFGVKGFTLSMIETALEVTGGRIESDGIQALLDRGKAMLAEPVELLPTVAETVKTLADDYRLVLITKGDLLHQEQKLARSGLAELFWRIEIVSEKDEPTYQRVLERHDIDRRRFVMVGNSVRSDVLPVLAIGARAVHVPAELTWAYEHVDHDGSVPTLGSLRELPAWLEACHLAA